MHPPRLLRLLALACLGLLLGRAPALAAAAAALLAPPEEASSWTWEQLADARGEFTLHEGVITLAPARPGPEDWHLQLYQAGVRLAEGRDYRLRFEARSDAAPDLLVYTTADSGDFANLGLSRRVALSPEWREHSLEFRCGPLGASTARAPAFAVGRHGAPVSLRHIRLEPLDAPAAASSSVELLRRPADLASWELEYFEDGAATLRADADERSALRIDLANPGLENWHVQLIHRRLGLVPGGAYVLRFRARASAPTYFLVSTTRDGPPYDGLGLGDTVSIGTAWREHELRFTAHDFKPGSSDRLVLLLGGPDASPGSTLWLENFSLIGPRAATTPPPPAAGTPSASASPPPSPLPDHWFPFVIPWDEATPGTATDLSALNHVPAGRHGRVVRAGAHFALSATGERIRFFGVNVGAAEAFPATAAAAEGLAARLAKHGVNLVRLHHLDNPWAIASGASLFDPSRPDRQHFSPAALERLDRLVAALKSRGIYVNLNLKVSKELTAADGFDAEDLARLPFTHQKQVDKYMPRMIELQRDYARRLLTHRNAFTGLTYAEDPAVAFVELNNENSLVGWPWDEPGAKLDQLPGAFRAELERQWAAWLGARYSSASARLAAWRAGLEPLGDALPLPAWRAEALHDADFSLRPSAEALAVEIRRADADWHAQALLENLPLAPGRAYTLRFRAAADAPRPLRVSVGTMTPEHANLGLNRTEQVSAEPRDFEFPFVVAAEAPAASRLAFVVGGAAGGLRIEHVELRAGHSLPAPDLSAPPRIPVDPTPAERLDWIEFLAQTEATYAKDLAAYVREELGVRALLLDSQIQWGGLTAVAREAGMDFTDTHMYWNHPVHTGGWFSGDWTVSQKPLVEELLSGRLGSLYVAWHRIAGRPFSVSEYDHPAPQDHAAETVPLLAAAAARQDWDKFEFYSQGPYGPGAPTDRISGFFDHSGHPAKFGFYPGAAALFRLGLLAPAPGRVRLQLPADAWRRTFDWSSAWNAAGATRDDFLSHQVEVELPAGHTTARLQRPPATPTALDPALRGLAVAAGAQGGAVLRAAGPAAALISGRVAGARIEAGPVALALAADGPHSATLLVVALDGRPIASSARVLVTLAGRAENPGMGWNAARDSVGREWGRGPVHLEGLSAELDLAADSPARVFALDPSGARREELPVTTPARGRLAFAVSPAHRTLWWEIVR